MTEGPNASPLVSAKRQETITVKVSWQMKGMLFAYADRMGVDMSDLVRMAAIEYMQRHNPELYAELLEQVSN